MTITLILAALAGAVGTLFLLAVSAAIVDLASWLTTPRNTPDEHRDVTPQIELYDMDESRSG